MRSSYYMGSHTRLELLRRRTCNHVIIKIQVYDAKENSIQESRAGGGAGANGRTIRSPSEGGHGPSSRKDWTPPAGRARANASASWRRRYRLVCRHRRFEIRDERKRCKEPAASASAAHSPNESSISPSHLFRRLLIFGFHRLLVGQCTHYSFSPVYVSSLEIISEAWNVPRIRFKVGRE